MVFLDDTDIVSIFKWENCILKINKVVLIHVVMIEQNYGNLYITKQSRKKGVQRWGLASSAPLTVISPCCCYLPVLLSSLCRSHLLSLSIPIGRDVAVSTRFTLRANAHSGGAQVLGHCHSPHHSPCYPHPAVVSHHLSTPQAGARSSGDVTLIPLPRPCHSTHHPPHEQLLVRLEAGGPLFVGGGVMMWVVGFLVIMVVAFHCCCSSSWRCIPPPCSPTLALAPRCCSTRNPPHKQLLMRLVAGGVSFAVVVGPWSSWSRLHVGVGGPPLVRPVLPKHPRSTPRVWLIAVVGCAVVIGAVPPTFHHTSSRL
jgi:hypothetical protein